MAEVPHSWPSISFIQDGEAVRGVVANRTAQQLAQRTEYLKQVLDNIEGGSALFLYDQPISVDVEAGYAVYYDTGLGQFRPARAASEENSDGTNAVAASTFVWGLVHTKLSTTSAHILLRGFSATMKDSLSLDPGDYYLSGSIVGGLTSERPPVAIYVATVTDAGVMVNPTIRDVLEDHQHLRFELDGVNHSATLTTAHGFATITGGDATLPGWLDAGDSAFDNLDVPSGAHFGYNLAGDPNLQAVWPPIPSGAAYLEFDGVGVNPQFYRITSNGLWWMTNNTSHTLPWDYGYTNMGSSSSALPGAPPEKTLVVWLTKLTAVTNIPMVSSLEAEVASPLTVEDCSGVARVEGTNPGTGALTLRFQMPWSTVADVTGNEVVKNISGHGVLSTGHVVEGIKAGSGLSITGGVDLADGSKAGTPTLDWINPLGLSRTLDMQLVSLDRAVEDVRNEVPCISFPFGIASSIVLKMYVPEIALSTPQIQLYLWIMSAAAVTYPSLTYQTRILKETTTPALLSGYAWSAASTFSTEPVSVFTGGAQHARVNGPLINTGLTATGKDIVLVKITRNASDGPTGYNLYVSNVYGVLSE